MNLRKLTGAAVAAVLALPMFVSGANAYELVIPSMDYRTGAYAPNGIVVANGWSDYLTLLNERDGGINGVKIKNVTCETAYNTKKGVECYEKIKGTPPSGALLVQPLSTGTTFTLSLTEIVRLSIKTSRTLFYGVSVFDGRVIRTKNELVIPIMSVTNETVRIFTISIQKTRRRKNDTKSQRNLRRF